MRKKYEEIVQNKFRQKEHERVQGFNDVREEYVKRYILEKYSEKVWKEYSKLLSLFNKKKVLDEEIKGREELFNETMGHYRHWEDPQDVVERKARDMYDKETKLTTEVSKFTDRIWLMDSPEEIKALLEEIDNF